jgi:uncharacterized protein YgbK (DUF1537 family)
MLGKKSRRLTKYNHKGRQYIIVDGNKDVDVEFMDERICEQGERIPFINRSKISPEEFNKLKEDME